MLNFFLFLVFFLCNFILFFITIVKYVGTTKKRFIFMHVLSLFCFALFFFFVFLFLCVCVCVWLVEKCNSGSSNNRGLCYGLSRSGPVGMAAAAAIVSSKKRKRPHSFETNPSIRKRQHNRLLRKLKVRY